jgi:hypothetical protein
MAISSCPPGRVWLFSARVAGKAMSLDSQWNISKARIGIIINKCLGNVNHGGFQRAFAMHLHHWRASLLPIRGYTDPAFSYSIIQMVEMSNGY